MMCKYVCVRIFTFVALLNLILGLVACASVNTPVSSSFPASSAVHSGETAVAFSPDSGKGVFEPGPAAIAFPRENLLESNSCYRVSLFYPYTAQERIDSQIGKYARDLYNSFVPSFSADCAREQERPGQLFELTLDYSCYSSSPEVISILFVPWMYSGGAHGLGWLESMNFSLVSALRLDYSDIFSNLRGFYEFLSVYARQSLRPKLGELWDSVPGFMDGLEPKAENFNCFVLKPGGLELHFPAYQVASYADGPQECFVPLELLLPFRPKPGIWR